MFLVHAETWFSVMVGILHELLRFRAMLRGTAKAQPSRCEIIACAYFSLRSISKATVAIPCRLLMDASPLAIDRLHNSVYSVGSQKAVINRFPGGGGRLVGIYRISKISVVSPVVLRASWE